MTTNSRTRRWRGVAAIALVGVLALASCSDNKSDGSSATGTSSGAKDTTIRISSQDFSEQKTLAQVYGQYLEAKGFKVQIQDPIGTRTQIFAALKAGKVDLEPDYSGPALLELKGTPTSDADKTYDDLVTALKAEKLDAGAKAEAADADALVTLKSYADAHDLKTISDLSKIDSKLTLGGAAECAEREQCLKGYNGPKYALGLGFKAVDYGPPLVAALKADEIQVAQYGTTAPEISQGEIVALEDDKGLLTPANVVPVYRAAVASPELTKALDALSKELTTKDLADWNQATDVDKKDPIDVATAWLQAKGLI